MASILIVCTGNICRSPMAEGILRQLLAERGAGEIRVDSAGVAGWQDQPATQEAILAMQERGIDIAPHLARRLGRQMIDAADLIVGMTIEHRDTVAKLSPAAAARTFTLKELVGLLERSDLDAPPGDSSRPEDRLRLAVLAAERVRSEQGRPEVADGDVADPLGLGLEAYRAAAWEIGEFSARLADAIFGPGPDIGPIERVAAERSPAGERE
jgi:protein-tyrosine-phosphatase